MSKSQKAQQSVCGPDSAGVDATIHTVSPEIPCPNGDCHFQMFTAPSVFGVRDVIPQSKYSEFDSPCRHFIDRYRPAHDDLTEFLAEVEATAHVGIFGATDEFESLVETPLVAYHLAPGVNLEELEAGR